MTAGNVPIEAPAEWQHVVPRLQRAVETVLRQERAPAGATVSVLLTGDAALQSLNRTYRGIDAPTDVLSFPIGETDPVNGVLLLGDVILSTERAVAQAMAMGHDPEDELTLLVIHGTLHLLGYDHATPEEKAAMWAAQRTALAVFDLDGMKISEA